MPYRFCFPAPRTRLLLLSLGLGVLFLSRPADAQETWAVTTFAGEIGSSGAQDGLAWAARFSQPRGIAVDASGQVFVADTFNHTIRKISPGGEVSTFAGTVGTSGSADGQGTGAQFNSPAGLAIDGSGNLYVADMLNHTIRQISPNGTVTTVAGSAGNAGSEDGTGTSARFKEPVGIAVDSGGTLYVADSGNSVLRRIAPGGAVSTLAGKAGETGHDDGFGAQARFDTPYGVTVDGNGTLYVADTFNHTIRQVTSAGSVSTLAGAFGERGSSDGSGSGARFSGPASIIHDGSGTLYVTEAANHLIRKITGSQVTTLAGAAGQDGATNGEAGAARFNAPYGLAFAPAQYLYVSDTLNSAIRKLTRVTAPPPPPPNPGGGGGGGGTTRLQNISTRSYVGVGARTQVAGFIITGSQPKQVLIRAAGPALPDAVPDRLADPVLELFDGTMRNIATNDNWSSHNADQIETLSRRFGPFSWTRGSKDAALVVTLAPGGYTAAVSGKDGGSGIAIVEVFDADAEATDSRLFNLSTRSDVRPGVGAQVAGFIIGGQKRVLIRAGSRSMENNVQLSQTGLLADPVLTIYNQQMQVIARNDDWGSEQATIEAAFAECGLPAWRRGTADAAILLDVPAGGYTAEVTGKNGSSGIAIVEVFEMP